MEESARHRRMLLLSVTIAAGIFATVGVLIWLGRSSATFTPAALFRTSVGPTAQRKSLVENALRQRANDPSSLSIEKVLYSWRTTEPDGHVHQYALACYREKNPFGALTYYERVLRIVDDQKVVWLGSEEERLHGNSSSRWVADPNGPPGKPY